MNAQQYNEAFENILKGLNAAQRQVVDDYDGPSMVIAGPGTGKTHVLTARIGRILLETDTQPYNILCLTFTDAGVIAMRQRLLQFIGPAAHQVHIYTFHSFCNSIIQSNRGVFGKQQLEALSDLDKVEFIRQLMDELPATNPLVMGRADRYYYEKHLAGLFDRIKSEHWTVEMVQQAIVDYVDDLPSREEYRYQRNQAPAKKGDIKQAQLNKEINRMQLLSAAVELYPKYVALLSKAGRYDFNDMILWVLDAFSKDEALLRSYQEQYLYVLADEYQDTNGAQHELVMQLVDYWEMPNVFIVGDDDQSIYEFQGARIKHLTDFYKKYQTFLSPIILDENYRSIPNVLKLSDTVIKNNQLRLINQLKDLGLNKQLKAANAALQGISTIPQLSIYENKQEEVIGVFDKINRLYKEGVAYRDIAVIYAKHKQVVDLQYLLDKKGVPYNIKKRQNILDLPIIRNLRLILEYVWTEFRMPYSGEVHLFKILHLPFWGIGKTDLAKLSLYIHQSPEKLIWRDILLDKERLEQAGVVHTKAFEEVGRLIDDLLGDILQTTVPLLIERLLNQSGWLRFIAKQYNQWEEVQVLRRFADFVREEAMRRPRLTLDQLLVLLTNMDANRIAIAAEQSIHAKEGIHLVTAHSAKGLEFKHVFLLDCTDDTWGIKGKSSRNQFKYPDTITYSGTVDEVEARRRLFYVAMTRAEEQLYCSYALLDNKGKPIKHLPFIDECRALMTEQKEESTATTAAAIAEVFVAEVAGSLWPHRQKEAIDALLADFKLSISGLNQFLRCPLSFFYERILRVPSTNSIFAAYGTAIHFALEKYFERMLAHPQRLFPSVDDLVGYFEQEMERQAYYFDAKEYERRLEMGQLFLRGWHEQQAEQLPTNVWIERLFRQIEIDGVPVNGIIDRVDITNDTEVRIVDYKTGKPKKEKLNKPTAAKPLGGDYYRQLLFYKLLFEGDRRNTRIVKQAAIAWMTPDDNGQFLENEITFSAKEISTFKETLTTTWQKIQNHEFEEGCNEESCEWCAFTKDINQTSYRDKNTEELDDEV